MQILTGLDGRYQAGQDGVLCFFMLKHDGANALQCNGFVFIVGELFMFSVVKRVAQCDMMSAQGRSGV